MSRLPKNRIPIEKFTSEEIDLGENLDETLIELVGANEINWFLTEDEKLILKNSNNPTFNFDGMPSDIRNKILQDMKLDNPKDEEPIEEIKKEENNKLVFETEVTV